MSALPSSSSAAVTVRHSSSESRLRQFHSGLDPNSEPEKSKSTSVHAAPQLYRHALESVFGFLSLAELSFVLAVSRDWSAAVGTMRSISAPAPRPSLIWRLPPLDLRRVCASRLSRHVSALGGDCRRVSSDSDTLALLSVRMPHLTSLQCKLDLAPPPPTHSADAGL
jgi:hypothetical protein